MAKWEAARYVELLEKSPCFEYPTAESVVTEDGRVFHDA